MEYSQSEGLGEVTYAVERGLIIGACLAAHASPRPDVRGSGAGLVDS